MARDVVGECFLFASEIESDFLGEARSGFARHVHMPAAVFLLSSATEDPEIQKQQLNLLRQLVAGRAEDDSHLPCVAVAVEVRAEERADHRLRGPQDHLWNLLLSCAG